ncbi:MAG: DUF4242 domain-containing protein [Anaerolineae bacterium]|jgi:hypothetical protein
MARFMAVHNPAVEATQDQMIDGIKRVIASQPPETEWIRSWVVPEEGKLYCEWEAPNADTIRASLEQVADLIPIEAIYEVQLIEPEWYK